MTRISICVVALLMPAAALLSLVGGCQPAGKMEPFRPLAKKDYARQLPPGALALRKIEPEDYPDFTAAFADRRGLVEALRHSLAYLRKPSAQRYYPYGEISHGRVVASLERFARLLEQSPSADELNVRVRAEFDVYQSVGCDDRGTVLFTGYYTPIFEGRKRRDEQFRYPLYRLPPDVAKDGEGRILGRRRPDGSMVPYFTRQELEQQRLLDGLELAYLRSPFEAYVANVQGSAKLRLEDGSLYELGYAGNNGHEYVSVARAMVADKALNNNEVSLQGMLAFFRANPEKTFYYTWKNPRYVFFAERPGGPFGTLNTPVTPLRTIATDKEIYPRAALAFVKTPIPRNARGENAPFAGFFLDQDSGGAIRAPGRCDLYMGVGPDAEAIAGRTLSEGQLYYLFVKPGGELSNNSAGLAPQPTMVTPAGSGSVSFPPAAASDPSAKPR